MIYFDHAAATPIDKNVWEVMKPYFLSNFANPSSTYQFGQKARAAIDRARELIAEILYCKTEEIFFTASGTESNNWAIFGAAKAYENKKHLITTKIEHHSVLYPAGELQRQGYQVSYLNVDRYGLISLKELEQLLTDNTLMVSLSYANNEIGSVENIMKIGKLLRSKGILFHTDACQAAGFLSLNTQKLSVDLMTLNGGKIYGPKGSGMLYVRKGLKISPLLYGGGQEHRLRSGTENVATIVGFAYALKLAESLRTREVKRLVKLQERLIKGLFSLVPTLKLNGHPQKRLPNNINISIPGISGESLLLKLDMEGVCVSTGSACASGSVEPSHVLLGIGLSKEVASSSLRLTLGRENTEKDIDKFLSILEKCLK
jgi:cysteine desulfurase